MSKTHILKEALESWQRNQDSNAANVILDMTFPMISKMCKLKSIGNYDYDDLISEGKIGILHAADKFELSSYVNYGTFIRYAWHWCRKKMDESYSAYDTISFTRQHLKKNSNIREYRSNRFFNSIPDDAVTNKMLLTDDLTYINQCVLGMSEQYQYIFDGVIINNNSQTQIADELNISKSMVNYCLSNIYRELKRRFKSDGNELQARRVYSNT